MRRPLGILLALLVAVLPWSPAAGAVEPDRRAGDRLGVQVLPGGPPRFDTDDLVWAKGSRIHVGSTTLRVGERRITWMLRTPYGFFLELGRRYDGESRLAWFDGERTTWLRRDASQPSVSPDGRLAGWVDRGGPRIEHGRAGRVQVLDLATGRRLWSTSRWMGEDTDVYEEVYPAFLGFDEAYAYWSRVEGAQRRMRTDLATWSTSFASTLTDDGLEEPVGLPYDSLSGRPVTLVDGRPTTGPYGGAPGFLSPDGRFAFDTSRTALTRVTDPVTGDRIDPDWGTRFRAFAGWRDADTFYAVLPRRFTWSWDPRRPDRIRGRFAACDLPSGACATVGRFRDVHRVVLGWGGGFEG